MREHSTQEQSHMSGVNTEDKRNWVEHLRWLGINVEEPETEVQ